MHGFDDIDVRDHDAVAPGLVRRAVTAGELTYSDGATQVFDADGTTSYVLDGRATRGEWYVDDDGHFGSFWPPAYRAHYNLHWMVEDAVIVGLRFIDLAGGARFEGRYLG